MSDATNLATIKSQIIARILEVTASQNPNYSIDGQSVSKGDYLETLTSQLKTIDEIIVGSGGPIFEITQGFTP